MRPVEFAIFLLSSNCAIRRADCASCDANWQQVTVGATDYCYRVFLFDQDYEDSRLACADQNAYLGRIHSKAAWTLILCTITVVIFLKITFDHPTGTMYRVTVYNRPQIGINCSKLDSKGWRTGL